VSLATVRLRGGVTHLAQYRGGRGRWQTLCYGFAAEYGPDTGDGMVTAGDWRGRGAGKPVEWRRADEVADTEQLCKRCVRSFRADTAEVDELLARAGA
jgi:hypothetical protein